MITGLTLAIAYVSSQTGTPTIAIPASDFLNSIGVNSAIDERGETLAQTIECAKYLGIRWIRTGIEARIPIQDFLDLHRQTGVRFSWGLLSGGSDLPKLIETAQELARVGALLSFEGPNEPNNWPIAYNGQTGGKNLSWQPVADLQRDLYKAVKADPLLKAYPIWDISENGAETDDVGLQFLVDPHGVHYADFANVHNYVYHPNSPGIEDNKTWNAADPSSACRVDGLYGAYGVTWAHHFSGYSEAQLTTLPRVTTETGCAIDGPVTEEIHALNLLSLYLDQFKRGWSYTAVYLLRDRIDEAGNQKFGFYRPDYSPRKAAIYLHNLTTILADSGALKKPGQLSYQIPNCPPTVHHLLLQRSNRTFELVVWSELVKGANPIAVHLAKAASAIKIFDPTIGSTPIQTFQKSKAIPLVLTDHPVVLEILNR
jgi:hypothetical protein